VVVVDVVAFDWIEDVEFREKLDEDWMDRGRERRGFPYEQEIAMPQFTLAHDVVP